MALRYRKRLFTMTFALVMYMTAAAQSTANQVRLLSAQSGQINPSNPVIAYEGGAAWWLNVPDGIGGATVQSASVYLRNSDDCIVSPGTVTYTIRFDVQSACSTTSSCSGVSHLFEASAISQPAATWTNVAGFAPFQIPAGQVLRVTIVNEQNHFFSCNFNASGDLSRNGAIVTLSVQAPSSGTTTSTPSGTSAPTGTQPVVPTPTTTSTPPVVPPPSVNPPPPPNVPPPPPTNPLNPPPPPPPGPQIVDTTSPLNAIIIPATIVVGVVIVLVGVALGSRTVQRVADTRYGIDEDAPSQVSCCDKVIVLWTVFVFYVIWTTLTLALYTICIGFFLAVIAIMMMVAMCGSDPGCNNCDGKSCCSIFKFPFDLGFHRHARLAMNRVCGCYEGRDEEYGLSAQQQHSRVSGGWGGVYYSMPGQPAPPGTAPPYAVQGTPVAVPPQSQPYY